MTLVGMARPAKGMMAVVKVVISSAWSRWSLACAGSRSLELPTFVGTFIGARTLFVLRKVCISEESQFVNSCTD
ncbi:hypothetical protein BJY52DRAFT_1271252 [Lactarius psammicola]|nr:hypothetical protein BJY52DRAFT_1271252 [Lactarius psammicola]